MPTITPNFEYPIPEGLYFNREIIMLIAGIVLFFLCVCSCSLFAVHSKYKAEKIEILKSIRENRWDEDLDGLDGYGEESD